MKSRRDTLRSLLPSDVDGVLVTSQAGRRYYTGLQSSAGTLLVSKTGRDCFIIDSRYIELAQKTIRDCDVVLQDKLYEQLNGRLKELGAEVLAVETDALTVRELHKMQKELNAELLTDNRVGKSMVCQRQIKDETEIESIVAAQRICEETFTHICGYIKPGMRERDIALEMLAHTYRLGGQGPSFDFIVGSGPNGSMPHAVPGDRQVQAGDFIVLDFGCKVKDYCSDMTRTIAVGYATDKMREIYNIVLDAQLAGIEAAKAGVACCDVDKACRDIITDAGYGECFGHGTGHSLGLLIHEEPAFSKIDKRLCESGMVLTVEPGIYLPGEFGVRIEDMVQVTETGCINLTKAPKNLICV